MRSIAEYLPEHPFFAGLGVFHSSEIPFVFGNDNYPLGSIGSATALVDQIQSFWTSFAIDDVVQDWPPWTDEFRTYEQVGDAGATGGQDSKGAACDFWDAL